jgi:hypothetical protein
MPVTSHLLPSPGGMRWQGDMSPLAWGGDNPHEIASGGRQTNRDDTNLCDFRRLCRVGDVPTDEEITFADHAGRLFARRYAMAPMVGRLLGYLAVCDPREQSITELADALLASRSAIAGAVNTLEKLRLIQRSRAAGERMDRVRIDMSSPQATGFDLAEYEEQGELAREGLRLLEDAPPERRAILLEWAAFADFLVERLPVLEQEWKERRGALLAAGKLPEATGRHREGRTR